VKAPPHEGCTAWRRDPAAIVGAILAQLTPAAIAGAVPVLCASRIDLAEVLHEG